MQKGHQHRGLALVLPEWDFSPESPSCWWITSHQRPHPHARQDSPYGHVLQEQKVGVRDGVWTPTTPVHRRDGRSGPAGVGRRPFNPRPGVAPWMTDVVRGVPRPSMVPTVMSAGGWDVHPHR
jgi:hypothetical protein